MRCNQSISIQSVKGSVWTQKKLNQPEMKVKHMPRIFFNFPVFVKVAKSGDSMWVVV
jgi:hypothetical protein